jgi:hypothetical protein
VKRRRGFESYRRLHFFSRTQDSKPRQGVDSCRGGKVPPRLIIRGEQTDRRSGDEGGQAVPPHRSGTLRSKPVPTGTDLRVKRRRGFESYCRLHTSSRLLNRIRSPDSRGPISVARASTRDSSTRGNQSCGRKSACREYNHGTGGRKIGDYLLTASLKPIGSRHLRWIYPPS